MTQYEQIIKTLKELGGRATVTEICEKMDFLDIPPRECVSSVNGCV